MDIADLEKLGFTKNESTVYLALLTLGSVSVGSIIEKTKLHRNIVYDNLSRLIEKGLAVFVIKANRKYFEAASPDFIKTMLEKQEKELKEKIELSRKILPDIEKLRKIGEERQEAVIYKGVKGVMSALDEILKIKQEIFVFGASTQLVEKVRYFYKYYFPRWHKIRAENKIPIKMLFSEDNRERGNEIKNTADLVEVKFIPKEFAFPMSAVFSKDYSLIITWSDEPIGFMIRSQDVANSMRAYFNALWNIAKL
ncbi:MAG: helix-turn-helix domain-containing protein [Candidatus Woesearchaeota archaeon]|nr:helix-turn-helix domain-containing protein [Candidatus Woesearchaeota archaeon]